MKKEVRKLELLSLPNWVTAKNLSEIIILVNNDKISFTSAKEILTKLIEEKLEPEEYAVSNNLIQENDIDEIGKIVLEVIDSNEEVIIRISDGEDKLIGFLVGQIIKLSKGKVNPSVAKELLLKEINS